MFAKISGSIEDICITLKLQCVKGVIVTNKY